jgi:hypothetical protein
MNIFILDHCPKKSASMMCDKHIPKMCVESAQMMASALIRNGCPESLMPVTKQGTKYKGGYKNHPCTIWAGDTLDNYIWLCRHARQLCREFFDRFDKTHACYEPIMVMDNLSSYIQRGKLTPFAQAMPDEFKSDDAVASYRHYYRKEKTFASWERCKNGVPFWWDDPKLIPTK